MLDRTDETDFEESFPWDMALGEPYGATCGSVDPAGVIIVESDGIVTLKIYRDHKTLHVIELIPYQMFSLHQKLSLALWKLVGLKDRL